MIDIFEQDSTDSVLKPKSYILRGPESRKIDFMDQFYFEIKNISPFGVLESWSALIFLEGGGGEEFERFCDVPKNFISLWA